MNSTDHITVTSPWTWAVPLIAVIGLLTVWIAGFNENLFLLLNGLGRSESGALLWSNITILGDAMLTFTLLSLFVRHRPELVWVIIIAAVIAIFWVHGLKYAIGHPRPGAVLSGDAINIIGVNLRGGSFPSGHTTTAFVLAGVICNLRIHSLLSWLAILLATMAGISRAVVGAHWPTDIFAGAFSGWLIAIISLFLFQHLSKRKQWGSRIPGRLLFNTGLLIIAISMFFYDNGYPASQPFQYTVATIAILVIVYNFSRMVTKQGKDENEPV